VENLASLMSIESDAHRAGLTTFATVLHGGIFTLQSLSTSLCNPQAVFLSHIQHPSEPMLEALRLKAEGLDPAAEAK
jgi:hypothetical protein